MTESIYIMYDTEPWTERGHIKSRFGNIYDSKRGWRTVGVVEDVLRHGLD